MPSCQATCAKISTMPTISVQTHVASVSVTRCALLTRCLSATAIHLVMSSVLLAVMLAAAPKSNCIPSSSVSVSHCGTDIAVSGSIVLARMVASVDRVLTIGKIVLMKNANAPVLPVTRGDIVKRRSDPLVLTRHHHPQLNHLLNHQLDQLPRYPLNHQQRQQYRVLLL